MRENRDFEVLNEHWDEYKLKDGSLLRAKFVLINVIMAGVDDAKNPRYMMNSQPLFGVVAPASLKGVPSEEVFTPEQRVDALQEEVEFEVLKKESSEYKLSDGALLKIDLMIVKVGRTSLHDSIGEPLYLISSQPLVNLSVPKELREKLKQLSE